MKQLFFIFYSFIFCLNGICQPSIQWQKTIGGIDRDELWEIIQVEDGYIFGGISNSNISGNKTDTCRGNFDYWILRTDTLGNVLWDKTLGSTQRDMLIGIVKTSDNGVLCGGSTSAGISGDKTDSSHGSEDIWIVKIDSTGNIQWQKTIGGWGDDIIHSLSQTTDGGFIIGSASNSPISYDKTIDCIHWPYYDYWVVKLDSLGNIQWQNVFGGTDNDVLFSIAQTQDKGFIIGGASQSDISGNKTENSIGYFDYWVLKVDSLGSIEWQKTIGGSDDDEIQSIEQANDGGFILGGHSDSNISGDKTEYSRGIYDYWIVKLNPSGSIQWQKTIGGNNSDYLYKLKEAIDGSITLCGESISDSSGEKNENCRGSWDYWVVNIDGNGAINWQKTLGGGNGDSPLSFSYTTDGGGIVGGISSSSISGDKTESNIGLSDYWIIKLSDFMNYIEPITIERNKIYPNPASTLICIELLNDKKILGSIYNIQGEKLSETIFNENNFCIELNNLSNGVYLFVLENNSGGKFVNKFVKIDGN